MYQIITDGSCDLGQENAKKLGVDVVPFYVTIDGEKYQKEIEEMDIRWFYQFMVDHPKQFPKSSLPSVQDYVDVFKKYVEQGISIICICITTKFSGSYNSAVTAKDIVLEDYKDAKIEVIDSTINTVLQGIYVMELARIQQEGATYEQVIHAANAIKGSGRIFFTIENMNYLVHGGRIGKLTGLAAGTLGIRPLIVLQDGEIHSSGLVRGRARSRKKVMEQMLEYIAQNPKGPDAYKMTVGYGYDRQEAEDFRQTFLEELAKKYPTYEPAVDLLQIGATIGVHTGPHPLGFGIVEKAFFE